MKIFRHGLYRIGLWLVRRYADQDTIAASILRGSSPSEVHISRVADENGPATSEINAVTHSVMRVIAAIKDDVRGASLSSIHDRGVKAMVRLHPEISPVEHSKFVFGEMRRNGLV